MNRVRVPDIEVPRPKCLPRKSESGVFRAVVVHANQSAQPANDSQDSRPTSAQMPPVLPFTSQFRSPVKASVRMEVVEILSTVFAGMSNTDVGILINEDAKVVQRIREGSKPWTKDHDIWLARRRPDLYAEMDKRVRGVL